MKRFNNILITFALIFFFNSNNTFSQWYQQNCGTTEVLYGVSFTDEQNGTVVGFNGTILRKMNGGTDWTSQSNGTSNWLNSVCFTDENNGTAVGGDGVILHTTNGGVSFVEEEKIDEMPTEFLLSQNYPNPFNPKITISFSIPQSQTVELKVFHLLGNEVATMLNGYKSAGEHVFEFNGSELTSGIYFFRIKGG